MSESSKMSASMSSAGSRPSTRMTSAGGNPDAMDMNLTTCGMCDKQLTSPKHFPCLHTYCEACLTKYGTASRAKDQGMQIRCPACMVPALNSTEPDVATVVNKMPTNSLLLGHVVAHLLKTKICKSCHRLNRKTPAKSWCSECQEGMCDNCLETHSSIQLSNRHHVMPIQDAVSNPEVTQRKLKCADHPREEVVRFCMEHQQACCNRCKSSLHSSCTSFLPLDRAVDVMRKKQELPLLVTQLDSMSANTQKIVNERKEALSALENQRKEQETEIKNLRERVNKHIDELENALREDFRHKHEEEVAQINQDIEIFEQKGQTVEYYKQLLDSATRNVPPVTVLIEGAKIRQQCQVLQENVQHRASKITRPKYELREADLINEMSDLGSVEVRQIPLHSDKPIEAMRKQHNPMVKVVVEKRSNFLALKYQSSFITGGEMLGDNMLLVDHKGREIRGYTGDGHRQDSRVCPLYGNPWDVAILPPNHKGREVIAITIPSHNTIQLVELGNNRMMPVERGGHFTTQDKCYGITYLSGNLLVACMKNIEVWELDPDFRMSFFNAMRAKGNKVKYLCAADQSRLYYTDSEFKGALYCVTSDSSLIFKYTHKNLRVPMGISVDSRGKVYVAGNYSNNIHQISPEGSLIQIIVPDDEGFKKPMVLLSDADRLFVSYESHTVTHLYPSVSSPRETQSSEGSIPSIPT